MRFSKLLLLAFPCALWAQLGGSFLSGDLVRGGSALVTPGLVPVVSALGTLGQSDVSMASGIFSRAGALGLATSGANSITMAPGGTAMLTLTSTGTSTFRNPTASTGSTLLNVQAGDGQSTNPLQRWANSAGSALWVMAPSLFYRTGSNMPTISDGGYGFGTGGASIDTQFSRASAGLIEVNNGTAGTLRDLITRSYIGTATSVATLANSQFTFHAPSNTELVVTLKGSDGTPRSVTLTLAP